MLGRPNKYHVSLNDAEIASCKQIIISPNACATVKERCMTLLTANGFSGRDFSYTNIAKSVCVHVKTVFNTVKQFFTEGFESVINLKRNVNSNPVKKIDDSLVSNIIALLCGPPPQGRKRWSIQLALNILNDSLPRESQISLSTLWRVLDEHQLKPHKSKYWCLPEVSPYFVLRMEDVLSVYERPYDARYPVVNMDECSLQVIKEILPTLPLRPGNVETHDSEYGRLGTRNIFLFVEPKRGIYHVHDTKQRTALDWAYEIRFLADVLYPQAEKIVLVLDNLNTHALPSLYKAFPPEEALRIKNRLEIHYTPKHGSWLNMAEIGINVMKKECIPERFKNDEEFLAFSDHLLFWETSKCNEGKSIEWRFTPEKARTKLEKLYDFSSFNACSTQDKYVDQNALNDCEGIDIIPRQRLTINAYTEDETISSLLSCTNGNGKTMWSINLGRKVEIEEEVGRKSVCALLGKRACGADGWAIPLPSKCKRKNGSQDGSYKVEYDYEFMTSGEDVIDVYSRKYDPENPVICLQKRPLNIEDVRRNTWVSDLKVESQIKKQAKVKDSDSKENPEKEPEIDKRIGITFAVEPLTGKRFFNVSDYPDILSWAVMIQDLVDNKYPEAKRITIVLNEVDLDLLSSLELLCSSEDALRIYQKLDVHVVPENAGWLNIADIESVVFVRQCLKNGIKDVIQLGEALHSWKMEVSVIDLRLDVPSFRRAFKDVYMPEEQYKDNDTYSSAYNESLNTKNESESPKERQSAATVTSAEDMASKMQSEPENQPSNTEKEDVEDGIGLQNKNTSTSEEGASDEQSEAEREPTNHEKVEDQDDVETQNLSSSEAKVSASNMQSEPEKSSSSIEKEDAEDGIGLQDKNTSTSEEGASDEQSEAARGSTNHEKVEVEDDVETQNLSSSEAEKTGSDEGYRSENQPLYSPKNVENGVVDRKLSPCEEGIHYSNSG